MLKSKPFSMQLRLLAAGCLIVLLALCVRLYIIEHSAERKIDSSPLPGRVVDAPFVTTPEMIVERMLQLAEVKKSDLVYDLGCGDGRIVVAAAKKYGCRAVGVDKDPERVKESLENVRKNHLEDLVTIEERDIFEVDLSKPDVVTLYLLPALNLKLIPQLQKMKPGARIVSHDWDLGDIPPDKIVRLYSKQDEHNHILYLWTAPLKKK